MGKKEDLDQIAVLKQIVDKLEFIARRVSKIEEYLRPRDFQATTIKLDARVVPKQLTGKEE